MFCGDSSRNCRGSFSSGDSDYYRFVIVKIVVFLPRKKGEHVSGHLCLKICQLPKGHVADIRAILALDDRQDDEVALLLRGFREEGAQLFRETLGRCMRSRKSALMPQPLRNGSAIFAWNDLVRMSTNL